jgi:hypothetical protein
MKKLQQAAEDLLQLDRRLGGGGMSEEALEIDEAVRVRICAPYSSVCYARHFHFLSMFLSPSLHVVRSVLRIFCLKRISVRPRRNSPLIFAVSFCTIRLNVACRSPLTFAETHRKFFLQEGAHAVDGFGTRAEDASAARRADRCRVVAIRAEALALLAG